MADEDLLLNKTKKGCVDGIYSDISCNEDCYSKILASQQPGSMWRWRMWCLHCINER